MSEDSIGPGSVPDTFEEYTTGRTNARFTDWLRQRSEPNWTEATTHRFPRELGADELDDWVFRRYLIQDYAFLETLVGTFGHAVGDAPSMAATSRIVDFLAVLTADEHDYFDRAFDALDVPDAEIADPDVTPTTRTFQDLLERAGREGGYAETLAVLVPAEWIYFEWATAVSGSPPDRFYLAEWIDIHAEDSFADFVEWLRSELDREGETASPSRRDRLERHFRRTVELEVAFFESAYESTGTAQAGEERW
ncbi:MAG: TenA family protein [Halodesulfurarchaeum sp.]